MGWLYGRNSGWESWDGHGIRTSMAAQVPALLAKPMADLRTPGPIPAFQGIPLLQGDRATEQQGLGVGLNLGGIRKATDIGDLLNRPQVRTLERSVTGDGFADPAQRAGLHQYEEPHHHAHKDEWKSIALCWAWQGLVKVGVEVRVQLRTAGLLWVGGWALVLGVCVGIDFGAAVACIAGIRAGLSLYLGRVFHKVLLWVGNQRSDVCNRQSLSPTRLKPGLKAGACELWESPRPCRSNSRGSGRGSVALRRVNGEAVRHGGLQSGF